MKFDFYFLFGSGVQDTAWGQSKIGSLIGDFDQITEMPEIIPLKQGQTRKKPTPLPSGNFTENYQSGNIVLRQDKKQSFLNVITSPHTSLYPKFILPKHSEKNLSLKF